MWTFGYAHLSSLWHGVGHVNLEIGMREHVFQADEDGIDLLGREAVEVAHLPSNVAAEGVERAVVLGAELVGTTAQREDSSSGSGREGGGGAGGDEQWPDEGGARRHCDVRASSARLLLTYVHCQSINLSSFHSNSS